MGEDQSDRKTALVLSGGGAYGAYQVGVIKALYAGRCGSTGFEPLDADVFTGTSVGCFNAAVMAMNQGGAHASAVELERIWTDEVADNSDGRGNGVYRIRGNPRDYLDPSIPGSPLEQLTRAFHDATYLIGEAAPRFLGLFSGDSSVVRRALTLLDVSAFINADAFRYLVERWVVPAAIRQSNKPLFVTATNWNNGEAEEFDFKRMTDTETWTAITASAAIPGLFPMVELWDLLLVDGGVVMNTPIKPVVDEQATELHVVSLNPELSNVPNPRFSNTLDTFDRVYTAMLATAVSEDIETARWVNEGIEVFERAETGESIDDGQARRLMRVASKLYRQLKAAGKIYRPLTIHRYYPKAPLGGILGMLDFHRGAIDKMIEQGYTDTVAHSCEANQCVIPATVKTALTSTASAV